MKATLPCAIYTRKSSEEGLEQDFNSLDAQREACEAFILSQKEQGWKALPDSYDDGGFSGGHTGRPGLQRLMADVTAGRIRIIVVYKVDRLTRSLADFAKMVELFDARGVSFVSVTQQFNTTTSMGRLTLNVLLSFAQFEREVTGERIRDKIAASKRKGMWMGGNTPLGYYVSQERHEAEQGTPPRALRWPAAELEEAVLHALCGFLQDESQLLVYGSQGGAGEVGRKLRHAAGLAERLQAQTAPDRIDLLHRIVQQVCVRPERIGITVRMAAVLDDDRPDAGAIALVEVPVQLKRYGMAMRLIVNVPGSKATREPDPKMVALLAKAHRWFGQLRSGAVDGVRSIAAREQVTASYVTWVIYLAFLAPDLVARIMTGDHPGELNAKQLLRMLPLPMSWEDQRTRLGMNR